MLNNSLYDTRNWGRVTDSFLAFILGSFLLATYGMYLEFVLFSTMVSLTHKGRARLFSLGLGYLEHELSFFLTTTSSASIWATTHSRISENVCARFLIMNRWMRRDPVLESDDHHVFIVHLESYRKRS